MASTSPSLTKPPTVDSHHHFWNLDRFDYEWMPSEPSVLRRSYLPRDLGPVLERNGVERTRVMGRNAAEFYPLIRPALLPCANMALA